MKTNFALLTFEEAESPLGTVGESFLDIFTSNIAIIVYICIFALAIISIAILFIINEHLTSERIEKVHGSETIVQDGDGKHKAKTTTKGGDVKTDGNRFQKLSALDKKFPSKEHIDSTEGLTLEHLCRRFRSFASHIEGNPLYYSITDIRRFIASFGVSKIMILQGMSGTGKTSLPVAWGKFTGVQTTVIPVQPMWKERSDLIGYYNEFTGRFNESMILEKLYEANKTNKIFLIVLDEMNIARVEYYFAEFLSLLELPTLDQRILEVTTSISPKDPKELHSGTLLLPDNVFFIGTANNDDSTFAISDKVYDRSMVLNLDYRCEPFIGEDNAEPVTISIDTFNNLIKNAKKEFALTKRGRNRIKEFDAYITKTFSITFGNRIRKQIEAYVPIYIACGGTELEALDDILAKKVLRKLEATNPITVKNKCEEIVAKLNEVFGQDCMPVCEQTIRKMAMNA
ncbi:MAG: AAA family ATPase [Bacilli bacterium]|nr:AAA family ATPase [Bacilli bacterium]